MARDPICSKFKLPLSCQREQRMVPRMQPDRCCSNFVRCSTRTSPQPRVGTLRDGFRRFSYQYWSTRHEFFHRGKSDTECKWNSALKRRRFTNRSEPGTVLCLEVLVRAGRGGSDTFARICDCGHLGAVCS